VPNGTLCPYAFYLYWQHTAQQVGQLLVPLLLLWSVWCVKPHQTQTLLLDLCVHEQDRLAVLDNTLTFKKLRGLRNGQKRTNMHLLLLRQVMVTGLLLYAQVLHKALGKAQLAVRLLGVVFLLLVICPGS